MNTAKLRNRVPSKKISRTSKVLDISEELDDYEVLHKLLAIIRSIQANATEAILCGFDGVNPPRTCGSTYGVPADEVEDASDTDHPLFYALYGHGGVDRTQPSIAIYDKKLLELTDQSNVFRIITKEALLAVIKVKT